MDVKHSCCCCLRGAQDRDTQTPYIHLGKTEIYSYMMKECFDLDLKLGSKAVSGICEVCIGRLRDARNFKLQVLHSQAELLKLFETPVDDHCEETKVKLESEVTNDEKDDENTPNPFYPIVKLEVSYDDDRMREEELCSGKESKVKQEVTNDDTKDKEFCEDTDETMETVNEDEAADVSPPPTANIEHQHYTSSNQITDKTIISSHAGKQDANGRKIPLVYFCKFCPQKFTDINIFTRHIRIHKHESYTCKQCNIKFTCKIKFDTHNMIHAGIKPYACNECDKQFSAKSSLTKHKKTHTGETQMNVDNVEGNS